MLSEDLTFLFYLLGLPGIIVLISAIVAHDGYGTDLR